jgi:secondary thiamine-phosphate synthase enzyme
MKIVKISIKTSERNEFLDITDRIKDAVYNSNVKSGIAVVYTPHTTAGITINENADPSVKRDIINFLNKKIPYHGDYKHMEGNADSHIKSSLIGCSETLIIEDGKILLGTWQGIFFCEFDGPRRREVWVKIIQD